MPVLKHNGTIILCGDYRVTINQAAKVDSYPLPKVEDLYAAMSGGKVFSKLDMSQAYLRLPLDDKSKELVTTHKDLCQYNRLLEYHQLQLYSRGAWKAYSIHCKMQSMKFIQNYHNEHTKFNFGMLIVVILYEFHTSHFAV